MEYRDYIFFLKENLDFSKCAFFPNIDQKISKTKIEIHHEPFTLFDIVDVVLQKYIDEGYPINELYIAEEVMELHYRNMVGLIPLSVTIHQMIHPKKIDNEKKIFIPLHMVYGGFRDFISEYAEYMDDGIYEKFKRKLEETKNLTEEAFNALIKEFEYIEVEGFETAEKLPDKIKELSNFTQTEDVDDSIISQYIA